MGIEKDDVKRFALDRLRLTPRGWTWTRDLFEEYKRWRIKRGMSESCLSVDAFGKFMPKIGEPGVRMKDGVQLRCFEGVEIAR